MAHVFYRTVNGVVFFACWDADFARSRPPAESGVVGRLPVDEDLPANRDELRALLRSLAPRPRVRPDQPPPPRPPAWRVLPNGRLRRPNDSEWEPAVTPERQAYFDPLPGVGGGHLVTYWTGIANDIAQLPVVRQAARTFLRLVRRGRQREGGRPDD